MKHDTKYIVSVQIAILVIIIIFPKGTQFTNVHFP